MREFSGPISVSSPISMKQVRDTIRPGPRLVCVCEHPHIFKRNATVAKGPAMSHSLVPQPLAYRAEGAGCVMLEMRTLRDGLSLFCSISSTMD